MSTPDDELVLVEDRGDWAVITLNRPQKRNAMNRAAQDRLRRALTAVHEKKAVVLTGVGTSFCSGIDLTEELPPPAPGRRASASTGNWAEVNEAVREHPAIFIAAVNGFALGGGSTLVHNSELAVAGESASIGTPEMAFGAWAALSGPSLVNRVLPKHAAELIFLAQRVDAPTALRMGIVNEVVPDDELLPRAFAIAERIAGFDATTLDWGKRAFRTMVNTSWEESMELSRRTVSSIAASRAHVASPLD
ncbi:enoyl-CoA hydratase/isomerase family protein [Pseudonocardia sp. KRD-184]|uniref:Enoyl-CoA hydratase/isomerase family protein n=1 Tax=Pseudonocardia oceani TaxID=2792013 RepID=A0ABS6U1Y0_9PSEU|nr:enoyl-CoA hydratase/isomerase family protein [Pseudonocardia oceani]MBW0090239.1 enoyl-CoA hydratase/isomerase family protein [Pseudonocardia oceani]MBW0097429.1 enoyl-CoA hydratase/isomerase family protein [Pseudonocardia oceani]MBW0110090.1 enoyl-CoA hydratase/isomerase family protein [Pseudonocardia oceani]MBW0124202.1 enoyl-CoA hydratase/isomerase family protein [Pseudonocardia oceani]MBW0126249.1 enoyl-CoA hydratase/isomerase family protein [Pseudonocardia oceani]